MGDPYGKTMQTADEYLLVTKNDTTDLPNGVCIAIWVETAGTLNLHQPDGTLRENFPVAVGLNPIQARRVLTGGTSDGIWALYNQG